MPQFDVSFFTGQIFWMLISFGFLYLMMATLICPMLEETLADRAARVQADIQAAEDLNRQAEQINQRYQAFLLNAEEKKTDRIQTAYARVQKDLATQERENDRRLRQKVRQAEHKIDAARQKMETESQAVSATVAEALVERLMPERETHDRVA